MNHRHVLAFLSMTIRECNGREMCRKFAHLFDLPISYGAFYTTMRRLNEEGLVTVRNGEDEDGRVAFYTITDRGRKFVEQAKP